MCGIAGIYVKDSIKSAFEKHSDIELLADALLAGIEVRGRDATGVVSVATGSTIPVLEKADIQASRFIHWRNPIAHNPRMVLLHSRLATKGHPSNLNNNHPVQYDTTFVTHNGMIMNDDELFEKHKFERIGQVDTEIIPALLSKYGLEKANVALEELDGSYAIAACDPVKAPEYLLLAKGPSSPLEFMETDEVLIWASTKSAIENAWHVMTGKKPAWNDIHSLRYAELLLVSPKSVEKFDFPVLKKDYSNSNYGYEYARWAKEPCICGDSKTMHAGTKDDGACLMSNCKCTGYIKSHTEDGKDHPLKEASVNGNLMLVAGEVVDDKDDERGWAQTDFIVNDDGVFSNWAVCIGCSTAEKIDDMTAMFGYWFCDTCATEEDEEDEKEEEKDDKDTDHGMTFDLAIVQTAKDLSLRPEYVYWLLFEADDKDYDKDLTLISAYCACDDLYSHYVEAFIGKGVSDIDKTVPKATSTEVGL